MTARLATLVLLGLVVTSCEGKRGWEPKGKSYSPQRSETAEAPSVPLAARRTWGRRGRCGRGRHPYPGIGDRHPIALQVVAAAGVADFPLD